MTGGHWRDKATPKQAQLGSNNKGRRGKPSTQADVLVAMSRNSRAKGRAVELPDIMGTGIAQHEARFNELGAQGFMVVNEMDHHDGVMRSRYRLTFDPELELAR